MKMISLFAISLLATAGVNAQAVQSTVKRGGEIASQPARDIGAEKTKIAPVLAKAHYAPYSLAGTGTCGQIRDTIAELTRALGPDFTVGNEKKENKAGELAAAGGKTVVNAILPFRGLVREVSGAGPAQRRLNAAIDAGFARRGFLRGIAYSRHCAS